jgi:lipopolysaccharide transport system ATP-binding protein
MRPIIEVNSLGKKYRIGQRESYKTLRESLAVAFNRPVRWFRAGGGYGGGDNTIWALKDVSFEVEPGEVIGIIGRNGAGKSTLLKIMSRITEPSEGGVDLYGRVGSLLEVGTGFHAELTGRENIYLSGAILGMKRAEIARKFDEIVAFAEVERFIETPVKRYSSGMYLRLAFAVAAHLDPEILVVDEVLAVGDNSFQKKCLGKMGEVAREGRTVLFVSHSMPAIQNLCSKGLVLSQGEVQFFGPVDRAVKRYLTESELQTGVCDLTAIKNREGSGEMRLVRFWVEDETGNPVSTIPTGCKCSFVVEYIAVDGSARRNVAMSIIIYTLTGAPVSLVNTNMLNQDFADAPPKGCIRFIVDKLPLVVGRYVVDLNLATHAGRQYADYIKGSAGFDVCDGDFYGTGRTANPYAPVLLEGNWRLE